MNTFAIDLPFYLDVFSCHSICLSSLDLLLVVYLFVLFLLLFDFFFLHPSMSLFFVENFDSITMVVIILLFNETEVTTSRGSANDKDS